MPARRGPAGQAPWGRPQRARPVLRSLQAHLRPSGRPWTARPAGSACWAPPRQRHRPRTARVRRQREAFGMRGLAGADCASTYCTSTYTYQPAASTRVQPPPRPPRTSCAQRTTDTLLHGPLYTTDIHRIARTSECTGTGARTHPAHRHARPARRTHGKRKRRGERKREERAPSAEILTSKSAGQRARPLWRCFLFPVELPRNSRSPL
eukprot:scaffold29331_cov112-Isochrysis_galbana.AAC.2